MSEQVVYEEKEVDSSSAFEVIDQTCSIINDTNPNLKHVGIHVDGEDKKHICNVFIRSGDKTFFAMMVIDENNMTELDPDGILAVEVQNEKTTTKEIDEFNTKVEKWFNKKDVKPFYSLDDLSSMCTMKIIEAQTGTSLSDEDDDEDE